MSLSGSFSDFELLVRSNRANWIRWSRRLVGSDDAEDLVQEAIARGWARVRSTDEMISPAYIQSTLKNLAANHVRDRMRRSSIRESHCDQIASRIAPTAQNPHDELLRVERRTRVREILRNLPDSEAEALRLFFLEELDAREVADRTGWTTGSARTIRGRALRRLRASLEE